MTRSARSRKRRVVHGAIPADGRPCAARSLTRRSETRPVTGNLCSRSNFSIAAAGCIVEHAGRLDLAVAVIGQRALHGGDARRRPDQIGDRIVAPDRNRLRRHRRSLPDAPASTARAGSARIVRRGLRRLRIGEERRRMRTRLQEDRVHDDDQARRGRGKDRARNPPGRRAAFATAASANAPPAPATRA